MIKAKSQFKSRSIANNVEIVIPVPHDVDSPSFKASIGTVTYLPDRNAIVWSIKQFNGSREYLMRAHFGLPSVSSDDSESWKAPIEVKFEIPYFTVSGIQARLRETTRDALSWRRAAPRGRRASGSQDAHRTPPVEKRERRRVVRR